jgi:hypothetical protein
MDRGTGFAATKEEVEEFDESDVLSRRRASINAINQGHQRTTGQKILSKLTGGRVDANTKTDPETNKKYHDVTLVKNKDGKSSRPVGKSLNVGKSSFQLRVKEEVELYETATLDKYIKSMGYDPLNMDKNKKVMFAKTNAFKTYAQRSEDSKSPGQEDDVHMSMGATARG